MEITRYHYPETGQYFTIEMLREKVADYLDPDNGSSGTWYGWEILNNGKAGDPSLVIDVIDFSGRPVRLLFCERVNSDLYKVVDHV